MWQLLKVLLRLKHDVYASFINISNDTEHCAGLSTIAELLVIYLHVSPFFRQFANDEPLDLDHHP